MERMFYECKQIKDDVVFYRFVCPQWRKTNGASKCVCPKWR
jgi:hypothetical protein